jgi:hypothetical protein
MESAGVLRVAAAWDSVGWPAGVSQEERSSFLKKRTKKLLFLGSHYPERPKPNCKKFFGSFF